jgi:hypothetical protein
MTIDTVDDRSIGILISFMSGPSVFIITCQCQCISSTWPEKSCWGSTFITNQILIILLPAMESLTARIANAIGAGQAETTFKILLHAAANDYHGLTMQKGDDIFESRFCKQ